MYVGIHFSSASALWSNRSFLLGYPYFISNYAYTVFFLFPFDTGLFCDFFGGNAMSNTRFPSYCLRVVHGDLSLARLEH